MGVKAMVVATPWPEAMPQSEQPAAKWALINLGVPNLSRLAPAPLDHLIDVSMVEAKEPETLWALMALTGWDRIGLRIGAELGMEGRV
jgi:hypothetical protein